MEDPNALRGMYMAIMWPSGIVAYIAGRLLYMNLRHGFTSPEGNLYFRCVTSGGLLLGVAGFFAPILLFLVQY